MAKEEPFIARADAERVRHKIASCGEEALEKLALELQRYGRRKNSRGRMQLFALPKRWVEKFRIVADQLRRDYRLEAAAGGAAARTSGFSPSPQASAAGEADPLEGLRLVNDDEAA